MSTADLAQWLDACFVLSHMCSQTLQSWLVGESIVFVLHLPHPRALPRQRYVLAGSRGPHAQPPTHALHPGSARLHQTTRPLPSTHTPTRMPPQCPFLTPPHRHACRSQASSSRPASMQHRNASNALPDQIPARCSGQQPTVSFPAPPRRVNREGKGALPATAAAAVTASEDVPVTPPYHRAGGAARSRAVGIWAVGGGGGVQSMGFLSR